MNRALLKNTAWGALGEFAVRGAKIAQVVLIARLLGAEDLGRFSYGVALVGLFGVLFDFGILPVAVKALSQEPGSAALRVFARLKLLTTVAGLAMLGAATVLSKSSPADAWIAFGIGVYLALNDLATFVVATYRARGEFWRETSYRGTTAVLQLVVCLVTILLTHRLGAVVAALIATAAFGMVPLLLECRRQPAIQGHGAGAAALRQCLPLAGSILAASVYMNLDTVVLASHAPLEEVGWYGVAVKAIFGLMIVPLHYLLSASFPAFATELATGTEAATSARWMRGFVLSSTAGAVLSLITALLAGPLITLLFGANLVAATPMLEVFTLIGFMFYLYTPLSQWLLLQGRQNITLYIQGAAMAVNLIAVPLCVPAWGIWGAVGASFATHLTIALAHGVVVLRGADFADTRSELWALSRLVAGTSIAIALIHFQAAGVVLSKLLAVAAFGMLAHRECIALTRHFQISPRKLAVKAPGI